MKGYKRFSRSFMWLEMACVIVLLLSGCAIAVIHQDAPRMDQITGAGSTFDYPFFSRAFYAYADGPEHLQVNYQSIGSGGGIEQFIRQTVNFGATDVPMNDSELQQARSAGPVEQVPVALGAEAITYNLPHIRQRLHFTGRVLADIYLGKVLRWNSPEIAKINPGIRLPSSQIVVVHRSDGSGTTYIFTDFLSQSNQIWAKVVGTGKSVDWPVGIGGKGNTFVTQEVQNTPGAIGYVELAYALTAKMNVGMVQNRYGSFVEPNLHSVTAAARQFAHVTSRHFSIVNAPGKDSYPICGYSWVLLYEHQTNRGVGEAMTRLFSWLVTSGQSYAQSVDYVPLPQSVKRLAQSLIKRIAYHGQPLLQ